MNTRLRTRITAALLTCVMTVSLLPASVFAHEPETAAPAENQLDYSTAALTMTAEGTLSEPVGSTTLTLTRGGGLSKEYRAQLLVYDKSAELGRDYSLTYEGEPVEKLPGSTSIYGAFHERGEYMDGLAMEVTIAMDRIDQLEHELPQEELSAADKLRQLDELNACAAQIPVVFAPGQDSVRLDVQVLDDAVSEYDEEFFVVALDQQGELVKEAMKVCTITDNEPAPVTEVSFSCEPEIRLQKEGDEAELRFTRTGNLNTVTLATLQKNDQLHCQVVFVPGQALQTITPVGPGLYALLDEDLNPIEGQVVNVIDERPTQTTTAPGGDPELDAVPAEYAPLPYPTALLSKEDDLPKIPEWAQGGSYEDENSIVVVGSTGNNLFHQGGTSGNGEAEMFHKGLNCHLLNTEGFYGHHKTSNVYLDSNTKYNFTGIESVETTMETFNLETESDISLGVQDTGRYKVRADHNGVYEMIYQLPDKYRETQRYVFLENHDYAVDHGGMRTYAPNALKFNLRQYCFIIEDDPSLVTPLNYTGGPKPGNHVPLIDSRNRYQYLTINSKDYGANKKVAISYNLDSGYPARLIGYKIRNIKTGISTSMIPLHGSVNNMSGEASFGFGTVFLSQYEDDYCARVKINGRETWAFHIIPVYEKIPVSYELRNFDGRSIKVNNTDRAYLGDKLVLSSDDDGLSGVWYQEKDDTSSGIKGQYISETLYDGKPGAYTVDLQYPKYLFQGVFSQDAAILDVRHGYGEGHGILAQAPGVWVDQKDYIAGEYFPLVATADPGYVTKWENHGIFYYGDTFHYQLDGHPDHNSVLVHFVQEPTEVADLTGTLTSAYVNLRTGLTTQQLPVANAEITIRSDKVYTAKTDEKGNFSIPAFKGVKGGVYSAMVLYNGGVTYTTFEFKGQFGPACSLHLPQFPDGCAYPERVSASVDGKGMGSNMLNLTENGTLEVSVQVRTPAKKTSVSEVNVYFLDPTKKVDSNTAGTTPLPLKCDVVMGDIQFWKGEIPASNLISGSRIFVEVFSDRTVVNMNGEEIITLSTGLADGGYQLITPHRVDDVSVQYDVPEVPGLINAKSTPPEQLKIPLIGSLDFGITTNSGAFFCQRTNPDESWTLVCGHTSLQHFPTASFSERLQKGRADQETAAAKKKDPGEKTAGSANTEAVAARPGEPKKEDVKKGPSNFKFSPAWMYSFTMDKDSSEVKQFEIILGVDLCYVRNFPFNVYGVPLYVRVNFTTEFYLDLQANLARRGIELDDSEALLSYLFGGRYEEGHTVDCFFVAPFMKLALRGGVGFAGLAGVYLEGAIQVPFIISIIPLDATFQLQIDLAAGVELAVFNFALNIHTPPAWIGNEELKKNLQLAITPYANQVSSPALPDGPDLTDPEEFNKALKEGTFQVISRPNDRRASGASGVIAPGAFKNTQVQLFRCDDGRVLSFFVTDNGSEEGTLNYLSAMYASSTDGGKTWSEPAPISPNAGQAPTSIQYGLNLFQLQDRLLVTWSEANFDKVLEGLQDVDLNKLTPAQIAACMNAMSLKGRFMTLSGEPMGQPFFITDQMPTVCCGALDAVQNGDNVYVYYQRNNYPVDADTTVEDLVRQERTIAMAYTTVQADGSAGEWTSRPVRALNENGQQYRITEVVPFVHDGILGEIAVLDRDGRLADWDAATETWIPSVEDRQMYLRTYDIDADTGEPTPTALMAITEPDGCSQFPQVISNDRDLHLLWNKNGSVVYMSDFVASSKDHSDVQDAAYVLVKDGTVTMQHQGEYNASSLTSSDEFHVGTRFTASMSEDSNVLVSWIAPEPLNIKSLEDLSKTSGMEPDQIYGAMFRTVSNQEARKLAEKRVGETESKGSPNMRQLYPLGLPVKLTDVENSLIGSLDSLCLDGSGKNADADFLLAYSKLNSNLRQSATAADVMTVTRPKAPDLVIREITAPEYPMPGSDIDVIVTVANEGLASAEKVKVNARGLKDKASAVIPTLAPGTEQSVTLTLTVPGDFDQTEALAITADAARCEKQTDSVEIKYGPYFVIDQQPAMENIPDTPDYRIDTTVRNLGNAAGRPTLSYTADLFAVQDDPITAEYTAEEEVLPDSELTVSYLWEDSLLSADTLSTLRVTTGENYDQVQTSRMPRPIYTPAEKTVERETLPDGTVVETTTQPDGSSVAELVKPDGSRGTVSTSAEGRVQAQATVSRQGLSDADATGRPAMLALTPLPVDAELEVLLENRSAARVTVPVRDMAPGVVPVLLRPDGSEEVLRNSSVSGDGLTFTAHNGDKLRLINNAAVFDDTAGHWGAGAIDFVSSRYLYRGVGGNSFAPNLPMNRAMLTAVLHNLEGNPEAVPDGHFLDVKPGFWYEQPIYWAVEEGVASGYGSRLFGPDDNATREQVAIMLYNYSGQPQVESTKLDFVDRDEISSYALTAVQWAAANGILNGNDRKELNPLDFATRTEVAAMIMNYLTCCSS